MIIDCIADLHGFFPKLDGGDLLIVAGDLTASDTPQQHLQFVDWCRYLPYRKIIVIAGNHDMFLQNIKSKYFGMPVYHDHCEYLCDSGTEFEGLKIWGSPCSLIFEDINPRCTAFTGTEKDLAEKFALIPDEIDILITHTPPFGILDGIPMEDGSLYHVGSKSLALKVGKMKNPPQLWIVGHIHEAYGEDLPTRDKPCKIINCSHVNKHYQPVNKPIRIIL